jgi:uncharacterized protein with HEPN domain
MTRNTILYLRDILDNMRWAEEFVGGVTHEVFAADRVKLSMPFCDAWK